MTDLLEAAAGRWRACVLVCWKICLRIAGLPGSYRRIAVVDVLELGAAGAVALAMVLAR